jgi:hypothetical protein
MIHLVVPSIVSSLNEFIRNELNLQEDMVLLTNPVDLKGNVNSQIDNKLCVFLQHLEEERIIKNGSYQTNGGINPPMHFSLYLMFVSNFPDPNYLESLRYLSLVLEFFQGIRVFDRSNSPLLSLNVEKVSMEYVNLDFKELTNVWSLLGLKYMPSLLYKLKLLSFTNSLIREEIGTVIGNASQRRDFNATELDQTGQNISNSSADNPFNPNKSFISPLNKDKGAAFLSNAFQRRDSKETDLDQASQRTPPTSGEDSITQDNQGR